LTYKIIVSECIYFRVVGLLACYGDNDDDHDVKVLLLSVYYLIITVT